MVISRNVPQKNYHAYKVCIFVASAYNKVYINVVVIEEMRVTSGHTPKVAEIEFGFMLERQTCRSQRTRPGLGLGVKRIASLPINCKLCILVNFSSLLPANTASCLVPSFLW